MHFQDHARGHADDTAPFYYSYYEGRGRHAVASQLRVSDPFSLSPAQILRRVLIAGYGPMLDKPRRIPFFEFGDKSEVERGDQWFLLSISRELELITVQEIRDTLYPQR